MSDRFEMQTPLNRVMNLGSAKEGTEHFWHQRLTALANVPLSLFLIWVVLNLGGASRASMVEMMSNPLVAGLMVLTIISITWHMRLGMQVVIEDYVHSEGLKLLAVIANVFFALLVAGLSIVSVLLLAFGG